MDVWEDVDVCQVCWYVHVCECRDTCVHACVCGYCVCTCQVSP